MTFTKDICKKFNLRSSSVVSMNKIKGGKVEDHIKHLR